MKAAALLMTLVMILCAVGSAWLYTHAAVSVENVSAAVVEASAMPDVYAELAAQLAGNRVLGTCFRPGEPAGAETCQLTTYTVRLKNTGFLPAEALEVQITPMEADILQMSSGMVPTLSGQHEGSLSAVLLSDLGAHTAREIRVTFYIWGIPFQLKSYTRLDN